MNFKEFIESDREARNKQKFEGNFLDYLEIVKSNPDIAKLAHKRMYDIIVGKGVELLKAEENPRHWKKLILYMLLRVVRCMKNHYI